MDLKNNNSIEMDKIIRYKNFKKLNRNLLVDLIDKIFVHEDMKITIVFKDNDVVFK